MKKLFLILLLSFSAAVAMFAQQTPDEIIPLWQRRFVPPANEVDSTFNSIVFKTEKDSFAYADAMNYTNASSTYGSSNIDTVITSIRVIQDDSSVSYIGVLMTADDVTGYPGYAATQNVVNVNNAVNNNFDVTDTFTVTVKVDVYSPSVDGVDTIQVSIYSNSASGESINNTTKIAVDNSNAWSTKTATLSVPRPVNSNNQPVMIILQPKYTAKEQTCSFANLKCKISN